MSLTGVKISEEVWQTCVTHGLSTESEEIMGLLLGDIEYANGKVTSLIWNVVPQARSDRRRDRVETNPEQLAAASAQAERISKESGRTTRVIGWYHSHPHMTVLPSHVDIRTQGTYQLLDKGFVGLIFSCFSEDSSKVGRIQAIAFQSVEPRQQVQNMKTIRVASGRYTDGVEFGSALSDLESDSPDHRTPGSEGMQHLSPGMQEAMRSSLSDASAGEFVRKEVPMQIVPEANFTRVDAMLDLQRTFFEEERNAYTKAIAQSSRKGSLHPLASIHHAATYQICLCRLQEFCLCAVSTSFYDRIQQNKARLMLLRDEATIFQLCSLTSRSKKHHV